MVGVADLAPDRPTGSTADLAELAEDLRADWERTGLSGGF